MASEYNDLLKTAAENGNLQDMVRLVGQGAEINRQDSHSPLVWAAARGHMECVRWLLERGAHISSQFEGNSSPLYCAASNGHLEVVRLLAERGADLNQLNAGKTALQVSREKNNDAITRFLERNPDQISFSWPLDNRIMQEVYHFPRGERVTLLRKGEGGQVETMQRESFASLGDVPSLRKAFEEHQRMGGKLTESDVFPDVLAKPRGLLRP